METRYLQNKAIGAARAAFGILLSMALALTMMPLSNAYAATSADYQAQMEEAQGYIDQYQAQLEQDQANVDSAQATVTSKKTTLDNVEAAAEAAEYDLNLRSQKYIDNKVQEAWPSDVQIIKKSEYSWSHLIQQYPDYETEGYKIEQSQYIANRLKNSTKPLHQKVFNEYNTKYGSDAFDKALTNTMGYYNTLEALDNIDTCNRIRGDNAELAKYWVNVMGQSVPSNTPQLKISPYLMVKSAVSATLNGGSVSDHMYGCCTYCFDGTPVGTNGFGQNLCAGRCGDNTRLVNPFEGWWTIENNNKEQEGHNGNIADVDFNQTGFAISNPNPYSGNVAAIQDFAGASGVAYTTSEYRDGLVRYCAGKLAIYEVRVRNYNSAKTKYDNAVTAYNNAVAAYNKTRNLLSQWQNKYDTAKRNYENALADESGKLKVSWVDSVTNSVFKTDKINSGQSVTPPTAPTHNGYTFIGWDSTKYQNVQSNVIITALYKSNQPSGQTYTITFKDGCNNSILKEFTVAKGDSVVPPQAPTHSDYVFTGWDSEKYKNVTANATITAQYRKTMFTITFKDGYDNTVIATKKGSKGSTVTPPTPPAHDGYKFNRWDSTAYHKITEDATVTALYYKIATTEPQQNTSNQGAGTPKTSSTAGSAAGSAAETAIINASSDEGPAGTKYAPLKLRSTKQTKKSVKLTWTKVNGASRYVIYGNLCNKANKMKRITTVGGATTKTIKKAAGKKLTKGKYYKFIVVALDKNNKVISISKTAHVATKGGKVGNYKKVTVTKSVTDKAGKLKKGQKLKLSAKTVKASKKKVKKHRALKYESSNTNIASVSGSGVITAKAAGICYISVYAQNGVFRTVKVVVR